MTDLIFIGIDVSKDTLEVGSTAQAKSSFLAPHLKRLSVSV